MLRCANMLVMWRAANGPFKTALNAINKGTLLVTARRQISFIMPMSASHRSSSSVWTQLRLFLKEGYIWGWNQAVHLGGSRLLTMEVLAPQVVIKGQLRCFSNYNISATFERIWKNAVYRVSFWTRKLPVRRTKDF